MALRLSRYREVAALARDPTPLRRLIAAAAAGALSFMLAQLLLGLVWGAGAGALPFASAACAFAAAVAAATMKPVRAAVYGLLGALWLLVEALVVLLSCLAAAL